MYGSEQTELPYLVETELGMYRVVADCESGKIGKAYLLYGEERYLVLFYRNYLVKACMGKDIEELSSDMNFTRFVGKGTDVHSVENSIQTLPFFAQKRVVLVEGSEWFKSSSDDVLRMLKDIPESTCVIFVEQDIDKRTGTYKWMEKEGSIDCFAEQDEDAIKAWICRKVDKNGKKITVGAVDALIRSVGVGMSRLNTELEKLLAFCEDKEAIERSDVEQLVHVQAVDRIFDMMEFIAQKKQKEALKLYYDLLELREQPARIIAMLERQYRHLLAVKDLSKHRMDKYAVAEKLKIKAYPAGKLISQAGYFEADELERALRDITEYERQVRTGGIEDRLAVELFLIQYTKK